MLTAVWSCCSTQVTGRTPFSRDWYTLSSTNASVDDLMATGLDGSFVPGVDGSDAYDLQAVDYGIGQPRFLGLKISTDQSQSLKVSMKCMTTT